MAWLFITLATPSLFTTLEGAGLTRIATDRTEAAGPQPPHVRRTFAGGDRPAPM